VTLVLVADCAYPFDYSLLPAGVYAIAGYVGGDTPHVWSLAEIAAVTVTGRKWWAIWTAPSSPGETLSAAQGGIDGAGMVLALKARDYPPTLPVFYDVEYGNWANDPAGARAGITAWKNTMRAAGYPHAFAYVPDIADFDWVAYWDNMRPPFLPDGWVGQQYAGNALGGRVDWNVFDLELLMGGEQAAGGGTPLTPGTTTTPAQPEDDMSAQDIADIKETLGRIETKVSIDLSSDQATQSAVGAIRGPIQWMYAQMQNPSVLAAAIAERLPAAGSASAPDVEAALRAVFADAGVK
jgi:hypothetical protein